MPNRVKLEWGPPAPRFRFRRQRCGGAVRPQRVWKCFGRKKVQGLHRLWREIVAAAMEGLPAGYRPNVGVCLVNSQNQVFVASRLNVPGAWQMPQGSIDEGEEPLTAALRELREETGIVSAEILAEVPHWLTYDFPPPVKAKVNRLWGGIWNGQAQKWFLMKFTNDDTEINLSSAGVESEFSEWKWTSPEEVIEQAVDYKRPAYEEVIKTFKPYLINEATSTST
ncbi:hypothetical protein H6P81_003704 [Aristolochia fimbriata]|uniref:Nudix hydrolase domain-containing protein n=1 Tax=Aristolochia fimbriata TaxID=158543 RepID=A0AAV7FGX5_ARIFI|nr:hypothetical protein H6P81_003704 [Aristolochia fimbriata]